MSASKPHSILAAQALEALDDLYHSTDTARGGRSEMWDDGRKAILGLVEQLEAATRLLIDLLSWQPQTQAAREALHPQHRAAIEAAEIFVATPNPAKRPT